MYRAFYGLKEKPFKILPDPEYLYMSRGHEDAYTHLEYAVSEKKGFVVITGDIGSGKTTLINYLLNRVDRDVQIGLINRTRVSPTQLIKMICQDFELDVSGLDKVEMIDRLQDMLIVQYAEKKRVVLIIDEAQNLPIQSMEELRMLSNLEDEKDHLIQMILVGQPELIRKFDGPDLVQFAQRVNAHYHLGGLNRDEVEGYILHRLRVGGAENSRIFSPQAVDVIADYSKGIPRLINMICDLSLVHGFADELRVIDARTVHGVIESREAGGILKAANGNIAPQMDKPPKAKGIDKVVWHQLKSMSEKINSFQGLMGKVNQRIGRLAEQGGSPNEMILEFLKFINRQANNNQGPHSEKHVPHSTDIDTRHNVNLVEPNRHETAPPVPEPYFSYDTSRPGELDCDVELEKTADQEKSRSTVFSQLLEKVEEQKIKPDNK